MKNKGRKKISDKLRGTLIIASIIVLIGLAGSLEQDMLTVREYIAYSVSALAVLAANIKNEPAPVATGTSPKA